MEEMVKRQKGPTYSTEINSAFILSRHRDG